MSVCVCVPLPAFLWCVGVFGPCVAPPCWRKRAAPLTMKKLSLRLKEGVGGVAEVKGQVSQESDRKAIKENSSNKKPKSTQLMLRDAS